MYYYFIIRFSNKFHFFFQISAQESRRKKKEFVDTLERKVELAVQELEEYKKKCDVLQKQNTTLKSQLKNLKNMVANNNSQNSDCKYSKVIFFILKKKKNKRSFSKSLSLPGFKLLVVDLAKIGTWTILNFQGQNCQLGTFFAQ